MFLGLPKILVTVFFFSETSLLKIMGLLSILTQTLLLDRKSAESKEFRIKIRITKL